MESIYWTIKTTTAAIFCTRITCTSQAACLAHGCDFRETFWNIFTQTFKGTPELKFRPFCIQSQITLGSLKRMRDLQLSACVERHKIARGMEHGVMADKVKASWFKVSTNTMCNTLKQPKKYARTNTNGSRAFSEWVGPRTL